MYFYTIVTKLFICDKL